MTPRDWKSMYEAMFLGIVVALAISVLCLAHESGKHSRQLQRIEAAK